MFAVSMICFVLALASVTAERYVKWPWQIWFLFFVAGFIFLIISHYH